MKNVGKAVGVLVLLATMPGTLTTQSPIMLFASEKPSGCHQQGRPTPVPVPNDNYRCCIAGHESAIVQPSALSQALIHTSANLLVAAEIWPHVDFVGIDYSSLASPPGAIPLRI